MGEVIRTFIHPIANAIRYHNLTLDAEIPEVAFCLLQGPFHPRTQPLSLDYELAILRAAGQRAKNRHVNVTPLARDGDRLAIHIQETDTHFAIDWTGAYQIDGAAFVYWDKDTDNVRTIIGYPRKRITHKLSIMFG